MARPNEVISGGGRVGGTITVSAPVSVRVEIDRVSSEMDFDRLAVRIGREAADKLVFGLRSHLDGTSNRAIDYMRG